MGPVRGDPLADAVEDRRPAYASATESAIAYRTNSSRSKRIPGDRGDNDTERNQFLSVPLFRPRRRGAVDVAIVRHEIERLEGRVGRIAAMDSLAAIADDHVLHQTPHHVVEDGHAQQREAVRPRNENRS